MNSAPVRLRCFRRPSRSPGSSGRAVRRRARRLCLEPLEARRLLALGAAGDVAPQGPAGPAPPAEMKDPLVAVLGSDLAALGAVLPGSRTAAASTGTSRLMQVRGGRVMIDAVASGDADTLLRDLAALGLQQGATFGRYVSGSLPIDAIGEMAELDSLRFARPAYQPSVSAGSVSSQGDAAMRADVARAVHALDGSGVTIGVLSDSYDNAGGAASDVLAGDLPPGVTVLDDLASGGADEGRAMMQLIHDVAPGADLAFHSAMQGMADFATGITELQTLAGADVIVNNVTYFAEPMFQDGIIAQAIDQAVANGSICLSAAGNAARQSFEDTFRPSGVVHPLAGAELHDFDPGLGLDTWQKVTIPVGSGAVFSFQWDSPFYSVSGGAGSPNDLDIFIFNAAASAVLARANDANVGGDAIEVLEFFNDGSFGTDQFNIAIGLSEGSAPGLMKWVEFEGAAAVAEYATDSPTSFGHANAAGALSVGAAFYAETPEFGVDPPLVEPFSSAGGVPILFDASGGPTFEIREKPDVTAPDGANTTFFGSDVEPDGFPNFFGTSAAAAHAAGVAALLLDADAGLTPADVAGTLRSTALDMDDPATPEFDAGFDNGTGYGLVRADAAVEAVLGGPASGALLGIDAGGVLYDVDLATGATSHPRPTGIDQAIGITFGPDGALYTISSFTSDPATEPNSLYTIDTATGAASLVGPTGLDFVDEGDLDFDPSTGMLYGLYNLDVPPRLFVVDPATGAATLGPGVAIVDPSAMAFDDAGTLFVLDGATDAVLATVDKDTGAILSATPLSTPLGLAAGMDFNPTTGTLFVADGNPGGTNSVYTLDPNSGRLTFIGPAHGAASGLSGLEFAAPIQPGEIRVAKWNDLDGDGRRDADEPPLAGWKIYLDLDEDGQWDEDRPGEEGEPYRWTDADGQGVFTGLAPGTYVVAEVAPPGWQQTCPGPGSGRPLVGVDFDDPSGRSPANWTAVDGGNPPAILLDLIDENGIRTPYDLEIISGDGLSSDVAVAPLSQIPGHANPLDEISGNLYDLDADIGLVWRNLVPSAVYELYVFGLDTVETESRVTISGRGTPIVFTQSFAADQLFVNDALGNAAEQLSSYAKTVCAGMDGEIRIDVDGLVGNAGLGAVALRPAGTTDGDVWIVDLGPGEVWTGIDFGNHADLDFGDAPDPAYPTLAAHCGAAHVLVPGGPFLGPSVDAEANGQPHPHALGDDHDGSDDEDGVTLTTPLTPGSPQALVDVDATASPVDGLLNAWIDFNADGDWTDPGEHVVTEEPLTAGTVRSLSFAVPCDAALGTTYARFRVSTQEGLACDGLASDGEVEDLELVVRSLVVDRCVFYNHSAFDDESRALSDGDAIAPGPSQAAHPSLGKTALLPGGTATFQNYTSYEKGINGIILDVAGLPASALSATNNPDTSDFEFRSGNDNDPEGWRSSFHSVDPVPLPHSILVAEDVDGAGTDRVKLIWDDDAIRNTWLQVTLRATDHTGLVADDVFYFGNAVGEAGDTYGQAVPHAMVNTTDEILARSHTRGPRNPAAIDDPYDYNRDGLVNVTDRIIARTNRTGPANCLNLITPPDPGAGGAASAPPARSACDAVLERAALAESGGRRISWGKLAWLADLDFEPMSRRRRPTTEGKAVEAVTDMLLGSSP